MNQDCHKTEFHVSSLGLYEFTYMPFGLSNAGSSFCRLMEMCLGDQQFITLLLYLGDACVFAKSTDEILDWLHTVWTQVMEFNLKLKPEMCCNFQKSLCP